MALVIQSSSESDGEPIDYGLGLEVCPPQAVAAVPVHGQGPLVRRSATEQHLVAARARSGKLAIAAQGFREEQGRALQTAVTQLRNSGALRLGADVSLQKTSSCTALVVHLGDGTQSGRRAMLSPQCMMSISYMAGLANI